MLNHTLLHADLLDYCDRVGVKPSSFGKLVLNLGGFAERLALGTAQVGQITLAWRFMAENPAVPRRQFSTVAEAWRKRAAGDGGTADGGASHERAPAVAELISVDGDGCTAGTLGETSSSHNREVQAAAGDPPGAGLAWILAQLGGHAVVAVEANVAVTTLEAMEAEGRIWSQHRRALVDCAQRLGFALDAETLDFRPLGREHRRRA